MPHQRAEGKLEKKGGNPFHLSRALDFRDEGPGNLTQAKEVEVVSFGWA